MAQRLKRLPGMQETRVRSLGREDPLEKENGTPLQYSCLENPMEGGAWWATVHGVAKSRTRLSDFTFHDPITIFLIVLALFSVDLFLLLCFLPREVPLAFVVKLISVQFNLVVLNSLNFCLFRKLLISPSNFIESPSW